MMGERRYGGTCCFTSSRSNDMCPRGTCCGRSIRRTRLAAAGVGSVTTARWDGHRSDPELLIRMLIVGYCFGIRSERRLCEEVHLNLAYRWFCGLGRDGEVSDHSTISKNRHGRFRDGDLLRRLFESVLQRCVDEGLVGGEGFAVDANLIQADASDRTRVEGAAGLPPDAAGRAVGEYLGVLDDAAFGAAT
jgi:transposase